MTRAPLLLALIVTSAAITACGPRSSPSAPADAPTAPADGPTAPAAPPAAGLSEAEQQAALASLPAPYNAADLANGKRKFALCISCHTIAQGGANRTGPNLYGVFGRQAGTLPGYNYSEAVKAAGFTWDAERLDAWLTQPKTYLPGTRMSFVGIKDADDRRDLIAYLKVNTGYKP